MGYGHYSSRAYHRLSRRKGYDQLNREQIFGARTIDPEMDPRRAHLRESRDSEDHPTSVPIIVGLDVTGSMGFVPEELVRSSLPKLMDGLLEAGIADPQVLFMGLGDFCYDRAPLQVGQFESSAELLDRWLTKVYLEGGGGGNNCESYNLAYLFAARHTILDSWEKRRQKGFLFTIGDEPCATEVPGEVIARLTPDSQAGKITTKALLKEARERYEVYHLHLNHDATSATARRQAGWKKLLKKNFVVLQDYRDLADRIVELVVTELMVSGMGGGDALVLPNRTEEIL